MPWPAVRPCMPHVPFGADGNGPSRPGRSTSRTATSLTCLTDAGVLLRPLKFLG